ncbi:MAG: ATP-binding protein [Spirochaetaceae bacterium]|nr:MAG: ATP-binding protein [Spirochaetaceae bacterium]
MCFLIAILNQMDLTALLELDRLAIASVSPLSKKRYVWERLRASTGRPFVALFGPRGSGKTVLLRQLRAENDAAIYLSADTLDRGTDLFDIAKRLHENYRISALYIDEIHFIPDYARHVKQIFDFLPVAVWFTSSVSLSLTAAGWDLSRRVVRQRLEPFSFREFLWFESDRVYQPLSLADCLRSRIGSEYLAATPAFRRYMVGGLHPFMLGAGADTSLFSGILDTVVSRDIPGFDPSLSAEDINRLHDTVRFIGSSPVDGINYSSVSRNVGITKYKAQRYLEYLERSFILTRVMPAGTNVLQEPKVLMQLPYRLVYQTLDQAIGALREEFFAQAMRHHEQEFRYAKSTRGQKTPDYIVDVDGERTVLEIGGPGKGRTQFKEVEYARKVVLHDTSARDVAPEPGRSVPLHCVGFA